ncbi:hypothetical protein [Hymenobacter glacieicola]|uniref:Leucine-rich repeat domain-containing protein n=1 Tax=Hymenobacter glacieicola TaxID=1562124 RepID=A0ABQ1X8M7_9BACT|nr:hypothetical protein [Hymenobacter glacieicola]GGG61370.1 hypothetical protein GCM10011378_41760 [Hymenobacter glacieicola]
MQLLTSPQLRNLACDANPLVAPVPVDLLVMLKNTPLSRLLFIRAFYWSFSRN